MAIKQGTVGITHRARRARLSSGERIGSSAGVIRADDIGMPSSVQTWEMSAIDETILPVARAALDQVASQVLDDLKG